jgi:hypothetical protein
MVTSATEVMFQIGKWSWELIICLLDVLKCVVVDVDEAMFQCVERPYEIFFSLLGIQIATWTISRKWFVKLANGPK